MDLPCPQCGRTLHVDDALAGQQTRCEHCGGIVHVPDVQAGGDGVAAERVTRLRDEEGGFADEFLTKAKLALRKKMLVVCGSCGERLTVEQRLAGRLAQCPNCGQQVRIPVEVDEEDLERSRRRAEARGLAETLDLGEDLTGAPPVEAPASWAPSPEVAADVPLAAPARLAPRRPRRKVPTMAWFFAIVVLGLVTLIGGRIAWQEHQARKRPGFVDVPPTVLNPNPASGTTVATAPTPGPAPSVLPLPAPGPLVRAGEPQPLPEPNISAPAAPADGPIKVLDASSQLVSASGLLPAPAGKAFLLVRASIRAGAAELTVETASAIAVETPAGRFETLGVPGGSGLLTPPARQATLKIPPSASRMETFVFLVPEETRGGRLKVADVGEADLPQVSPPSTVDARAVAGRYVEARRLLRVAFDDPVMDRLRQAPRHEIAVQADGESAELSLPPTDLRGTLKPVSESAWQGTLSAGGESIPCQLRLAVDGKRLILYLARGAFHQIVYERQ